MEQVIERLRARPDCNEILIAYQVDNEAARRLYESLGFVDQKVDEKKVAARLDLKAIT
jgi:ribosomal protein S18 acetylase RimI-like enzyme